MISSLFGKLNGKKTVSSTVALLALMLLRQAGFETDLASTTELVVGVCAVIGLIHKLIKTRLAR